MTALGLVKTGKVCERQAAVYVMSVLCPRLRWDRAPEHPQTHKPQGSDRFLQPGIWHPNQPCPSPGNPGLGSEGPWKVLQWGLARGVTDSKHLTCGYCGNTSPTTNTQQAHVTAPWPGLDGHCCLDGLIFDLIPTYIVAGL